MNKITSPPPPPPSRSAAIDLMRAGSILYIVGFWHLFNYTQAMGDYENAVTYRLTVFTLGLFTLLSGYLIGRKDLRLRWPEVTAFYKSRLLRIYPPYLAAIAAFAVLKIATLPALGKSVVLASMLLGPPPFTLWFMVMLLGCYVLAPVLIELRKRPLYFAAFLAALLCALQVFSAVFDTLDQRLMIYLPAFAAGIFLAGHPENVKSPNWYALIAAALTGLVLTFYNDAPIEQSLASLVFASSAPALFFCAMMRFDAALPSSKWIERIGYASFFLFLFHRPVYKVVTHLYMPDSPAAQIAFLWLACLPLAIGLSWCGQTIYDRLVQRLSPAAKTSPSPAAAAPTRWEKPGAPEQQNDFIERRRRSRG